MNQIFSRLGPERIVVHGMEFNATLELEFEETYLPGLSMNNFSGARIPEFFVSFKSLRYLNLSYSKLGGQIPPDLGRLSSLQYLDLHSNDFNGSFPPEIGHLSQLSHLDLSFNEFQGSIPAQVFSNLTQMEFLDLSVNNFSGSIPVEIFENLTQIRKLHLSNNEFIGNLPAAFQGLAFLKELHISNNKLSGIFPPWLGQLSELQSLDFSFNSIVGVISEDHMKNLTSLKHLYLSSNADLVVNINFTWSPPFQLHSLRLSSCNVGPQFPQWLQNQRELEYLAISNGSIRDTIPDWFENVYSSVRFLDLSHNQITDLAENEITGKLPSWIGQKLSSLKFMTLQSNKFHGGIPREFCYLSNLQWLNLAQNNINGPIPSCFGNLTAMIEDHSDDQLIAFYSNATFGYGERLLDYMKGMELEFSTTSLTYLISIDLSNNDITGEIPKEVMRRIPTGNQLRTLHDSSIYTGNPQLCGAPSLNLCSESKETPGRSHENENEDGGSHLLFYSATGPGFSVGFLGFCGALHFNKPWRYAYFGFLGKVGNILALAVAMKGAWLRQKFLKLYVVEKSQQLRPYGSHLTISIKPQDAGANKCIVSRFLDYKMADSKTVLPPAWKMFKNYLKHKRKEMTMEDLILRLRIEEDNRGSEKKMNVDIKKANMVEHVESSKPKKTTSGKGEKLAPKGGISKSKFRGKCYNCDKVVHRSSDCRKPKKANKKKEANIVDHISKEMGDIDLYDAVSEVNLVGSNPREWWIHTGASLVSNLLMLVRSFTWGIQRLLLLKVKTR
ncbi:hypothetical protein AgCh_038491 [Apium graveolens]